MTKTAKIKLTTAQRLDSVSEQVFARIANCEFIHKIAKSYGISATSMHAWLDTRPDMYARARERQADKLVADMLQIADDGKNDTYVDADGIMRVNQDVIARSRLRVEARKWLAGKMHSTRYGDNATQTIVGDVERPITLIKRVIIKEPTVIEHEPAVIEDKSQQNQ